MANVKSALQRLGARVAHGGSSREPFPRIPAPFRRHNAIFVHVPKCAGSTLSLKLFGFRVGHQTIGSYWNFDRQFTEQAFKFSFVRHPYLRALSAYRFLKRGGISKRDSGQLQSHPDAFASFDALVEAMQDENFRHQVIHLRPQASFLSVPATARYSIYMDYIGKTEFFGREVDLLSQLLGSDLAVALGRAKDVQLNRGTPADDKIDPGTFNRIRDLYADDFEFFGYEEWDSPEGVRRLVGAN